MSELAETSTLNEEVLLRQKNRLELRMEKYHEQSGKPEGLNEYQIVNYEETKKEYEKVQDDLKKLYESSETASTDEVSR